MTTLKILTLINNRIINDKLETFSLDNKFNLLKACMPSEAMQILKEKEIDIAIINTKIPEKEGIIVLKEIKELYPDIEIIIISDSKKTELLIASLRAKVNDFLLTPLQFIDLENAIKQTKKYTNYLIQSNEFKNNNKILNKELKAKFNWDLIVESKSMKEVLNLVTKVAKTDKTTVLITGESGTGKEIIANAIHYLSQRKDFYFNAVNCSAIPDTLFEVQFA